MVQLALIFLFYIRAFLRSRHDLGMEILALRQQLTVFKRRQPRPALGRLDRIFWVALRALWKRWSEALIIVKTRLSWVGIGPDSDSTGNSARAPLASAAVVSTVRSTKRSSEWPPRTLRGAHRESMASC